MAFRGLQVAGLPAILAAGLACSQVSQPVTLQGQAIATPLSPGSPVQRAIRGGESHRYRFELPPQQYLRLEIDQQGISVGTTVLGPDGVVVAEASNSAPDDPDPLSISVLASAGGRFDISITPNSGKAEAGTYRLKVAELRAPSDIDPQRISAERALEAAKRLRDDGRAEFFPQSLAKYEEALGIWRQIRDQHQEAITLNSTATLCYYYGDYLKALDYDNQALPLWHMLGDKLGESQTLNDLGVFYNKLGNPKKDIEYLEQALALRREMNDQQGIAEALGNLAVPYTALGKDDRALEMLQQALAANRAIGREDSNGVNLINLANLYRSLGQPERAVAYNRQALQIYLHDGDRGMQATVYEYLGGDYAASGEPRLALRYYEPALASHRNSGDPGRQSRVLLGMGKAYQMLHQPQRALAAYTEALALSQKAGDEHNRGVALSRISSAYLDLRETNKALANANEALPLLHVSGGPIEEANLLSLLGRLERDAGALENAREHAEAAVRLSESVRGEVSSQELRATYFARVRGQYDLLVDILSLLHQKRRQEGYDAQALQVSEQARARGLLDLLAETGVDFRQGVAPELLDEERTIRAQLGRKSAQQLRLLSGKHSDEQAAALTTELDKLTTEYEDLESQVRARSPRYAALTQPQPLTVGEVQHQILDSDTLLLEYALGEERSFLWAITADSLSMHFLPKRSVLEAAARAAYDELSANRLPVEDKATRILSSILLRPVGKELEKKRLIVIAEGALQYIPFAALLTPKETRLGRKHEIVSLPSASTLAALRRQVEGRARAPKTVAVLADPVFDANDPRVSGALKANKSPAKNRGLERAAKDTGLMLFERLVSSRREADAITRLAEKQAALEALDFDASLTTVRKPELANYRILHFASHSLLDSRHPALSGIVLSLVDRQGNSQDGFLQAHEIYNLKLNADLVVLSACQTALGKDVRGEGLVSLTRGFMYAGAPRVMASLWKVPDTATAELMKHFYDGVLREELPPAAALRKAQAALAQHPGWSAPYYWAGFVLQGEWR